MLHPRLCIPISDTEIVLSIQVQITRVSRLEYQSLLSILRTVLADELAGLPTTLDTLKKNTKKSIPLLELRIELTILLQLDAMPTRTAGDKGTYKVFAENLYFFNPQTFFQAYLSTPQIRKKIYKGLSCFVNSLAELQESNIQYSSIRITSGKFAIYLIAIQEQQQPSTLPLLATRATKYIREYTSQPSRPIFPSNFVRFECSDSDCECYTTNTSMYRYLGIVLAVAKDIRTGSTVGVVILRIRRLATPIQIRSIQNEGDDLVNNIVPPAIDIGREVFLLGNNRHVYYVLPTVVELIDYELYTYYDF